MSEPEQDPRLELPKQLRDALENYSNQRVFVPPDVDAKVIEKATAHLRKQRPRRVLSRGHWWAAAAVVAALLLLSFLFSNSQRRRNGQEISAVAVNPADIDGNGKVDIFDACILARALKETTPPRQGDVNGDGIIDAADVAAIAHRAVQLEKGPTL